MDQSIIPAHGRGRLLKGGKPGNKGGGRPPCALKAACRESFEKGIGVAAKILTGQKVNKDSSLPTNIDMLRALNVLGKYGFSDTDTILPENLIPIVSKVFAEYLPPEAQRAAVDRFIELLGECPN